MNFWGDILRGEFVNLWREFKMNFNAMNLRGEFSFAGFATFVFASAASFLNANLCATLNLRLTNPTIKPFNASLC